MDYDATTGEIYVPDTKNDQLVVLAPVNSGFPPPHEPSRVIHLGVPPASVAITSDGLLGFVALSSGNVVMLDLPGREVITTIPVGGSPHFIITGLYPPLIGTTPQQASVWETVLNIAAYVFVAALFLIPILLFRRYTKATPIPPKKQQRSKR
jgi:DNA-binding beta-propeller fold protein YncE